VHSLQYIEESLDPTIELNRLLQESKMEEAFTKALQSPDLQIVPWLCKQVSSATSSSYIDWLNEWPKEDICLFLQGCSGKLASQEMQFWAALEWLSNSTWLLIRSWLSWKLHPTPSMFSKFWKEVVSVEVWDKERSMLRGKLILAFQEVLHWVWPSMNWNRLLFIQSQTLPSRMHHKWKEIIGYICQTTNSPKKFSLS
jgi:hypothetical protein